VNGFALGPLLSRPLVAIAGGARAFSSSMMPFGTEAD
jgi:hypothetical protein